MAFGVGGLKGVWEPDQSEQTAAWEMYVELITRVAVVEMGPSQGLLREALDSLYSLFDSTRAILRQHGPSVARVKGKGSYSFGYLAVIILNQVLRPVLAEWHPKLLDYESQRSVAIPKQRPPFSRQHPGASGLTVSLARSERGA